MTKVLSRFTLIVLATAFLISCANPISQDVGAVSMTKAVTESTPDDTVIAAITESLIGQNALNAYGSPATSSQATPDGGSEQGPPNKPTWKTIIWTEKKKDNSGSIRLIADASVDILTVPANTALGYKIIDYKIKTVRSSIELLLSRLPPWAVHMEKVSTPPAVISKDAKHCTVRGSADVVTTLMDIEVTRVNDSVQIDK